MLAEFLAARRYLKQRSQPGQGDANSSDGGYSLIPQEEVGQSPGSCSNLEEEEVDADKEGSPKEEGGVTLSSHKRILWRLFGLAMQEWSYLALGLVFLVAASISQALLPRLTGDVINSIVIDKSEEDMEEALRSLTLFSLLCALFSGLRGTCFLVVNTKMNIRIRKDLYQSMLKQEIGFFDQNKVGDLTSRLSSDTNKMSDQIGLNLNVCLRSVVQSIGLLAYMLLSQWRLTLVTFIAVPLVSLLSKVYGHYYHLLAKAVQDQQARCNADAEEVIGSMRTVRSFGCEEEEVRRYEQELQEILRLGIKQASAYTGYMFCFTGAPLLVTVAVLYFGGHMVFTHLLQPGDLVAFVFYQQSLSQAINSIGDVYAGLMQAAGAADKVFDIIDRRPATCPPSSSCSFSSASCSSPTHSSLLLSSSSELSKEQLQGSITFQEVSLVYPSRPDALVLDRVSFHIDPGQVVALVGSSGSGKSSCISLIERFYEPTGGEVLLDGLSLSSYDNSFLRRHISLVGQEPVLYARSLLENIAYGLGREVEEAELRRRVTLAARQACADEFIMRMEDGFSTHAGERGSHLSGGQKQRIAIARALVRNPSILLLDEATSALDTASEAQVQKAIDESMKGRTVLVIAHRLSTIQRADKIIVLSNGLVVEQGTHKELLEAGGAYAELVSKQVSID
ncbi:hypothetical protein GUITHDRAFT_68014 [Guillardia theta CCMP2712]|uniref:ABC transporter n=2 Tax=Guillardia theta TaxID=55529 RepID=L1JMQ5_GUITC|nr:hypothetical protein GUITHDRAFT_68014 [Guillardia theta CCMP2712]EKX49343.1 hypothetical protein GUITHDRAFT_68014 [Guillardia theta CCMP2712]|eukprot:XP_005836323.1 hypothetical protein GUITHDRAFT_68014 [Guillardia theta CCMP2712]